MFPQIHWVNLFTGYDVFPQLRTYGIWATQLLFTTGRIHELPFFDTQPGDEIRCY